MERNVGSEWPTVAADLRWYFARQATGPLKSSYGGMVRRIAMGRSCKEIPASHDLSDEMLDAAERAGGIARVLRAVEPETADHLERAFGAGYPEAHAVLGELSGLAPLTRAAKEAHRKFGLQEQFGEWMRHLVRRSTSARALPVLEAIQEEARVLRSRAVAAYLSARRRVGRHG
jgi:hypothetical protein